MSIDLDNPGECHEWARLYEAVSKERDHLREYNRYLIGQNVAARAENDSMRAVVEAAEALSDWECIARITSVPCGNCAPCRFQVALRAARKSYAELSLRARALVDAGIADVRAGRVRRMRPDEFDADEEDK